METVGADIRRMREEAGLSLEELAVKAGLDKGMVASVEADIYFKEDPLVKIADALNICPVTLLARAGRLPRKFVELTIKQILENDDHAYTVWKIAFYNEGAE